MKLAAIIVTAFTALAGCAAADLSPPGKGALPARPVAVGYVPAFKGFDAIVASSDFSSYTHINLAFVNPDPGGAVIAGDAMACMNGGGNASVSLAQLDTAVTRIHAGGAKVLVSLGGGTIPACSGDWAAMLRPETRATIVRNLVALVDRHGLDGIDVDIEGELLTRIDEAGNYTPFIAELGTAMRARGKLLTCATASYEGGMVPISSVPWFDLVNVMSYDAIGPTWGQAGDEHAPLAQAERDMALWLARGVPRDRLVLGLPFYGYGFNGYRPTYAYREIAAELTPKPGDDVVGRRCAGCAYVTFNGLDTLRRKASLARREGAGVMVWEISQDTSDQRLIRAVNTAMAD